MESSATIEHNAAPISKHRKRKNAVVSNVIENELHGQN